MLKAHVDNEIWLVQQPHHAQVSGFLAAHWGGPGGFVRPGFHAGAADPVRWHDEVVLGIAEHDNGWWETEAMPIISERDGLPVGVGEAAKPTEMNEFAPWRSGGFQRWQTGIDRLAGPHPYAALLISLHAYWLYAVAFDDLIPDGVVAHRHFVFGSPEVAAGLVGEAGKTRAFLIEQAALQEALKERLAEDPLMAAAIEPQHLSAHLRLLQLLDSMSLYLALNDGESHRLPGVPRSGWNDRCTITWTRRDARTIELDPYPFDIEALRVAMPTRVVPTDDSRHHTSALARLHSAPLQSIDFTFVSRDH